MLVVCFRWDGEGGGGVGTVQMQTQWQGVNPDGFIQLAAPRSFSFGIYSTKAERDLKCSLGRDQAGSHFSLKPHEHKLAENKVTTEKQASFKASDIPLWSQKRWKIILLALRLKILQIHKKVVHWLFVDSQRFKMFFFFSGSATLEARKTYCFCFSVPKHSFCQNIRLGG